LCVTLGPSYVLIVLWRKTNAAINDLNRCKLTYLFPLLYFWSPGSSVSTASRIRDEQSGNMGSIPARVRDSSLLHCAFVAAPRSTNKVIQWVYSGLFPHSNVAGHIVKVSTHIHLVPKLKMCGVIYPLPNKSSWRSAHFSAVTSPSRLRCSCVSH
jgi:hypothetical protein